MKNRGSSIAIAGLALLAFLGPRFAHAQTRTINGISTAQGSNGYGEGYFDPATLVAAPGDTIRWDVDSGPHRIVADDGTFDSGRLDGGSYSVSFAGTRIKYHCSFRARIGAYGAWVGMVGTIYDPAQADSYLVYPYYDWQPGKTFDPTSPDTISAHYRYAWNPANVIAKAGDTIKYQNITRPFGYPATSYPATHTFTADDGSFDSGPFAADDGRTFSFIFSGTLTRFHCSIHSRLVGGVWQGMVGKVVDLPPLVALENPPRHTSSPTTALDRFTNVFAMSPADIRGSASDNNSVASIRVVVDGREVPGVTCDPACGIRAPETKWHVSVPLPTGFHTLSVTGTDAGGHVSPAVTSEFTVLIGGS